MGKIEYEKIMKQWDYWREQIADGHKGSAPRDWFESVIDYLIDENNIQTVSDGDSFDFLYDKEEDIYSKTDGETIT